MERRDIEIFLTLAEELHFGRTAQRLLISQARVSQTIARLERRFGVALFERTSRKVALTPTGAALYADVRAGHDRIERGIAKAIAAGRGITGVLTVGLEAPAVAELATAFQRFRANNPGVEIIFRETGFTDPLDLLRSGEVDVAVTNAPVDEPGFEEGPVLYTEPVVLAMAKNHRLADHKTVTLDDLDGEIVFRAGRRAAPYRRDPEPLAPATLLDLMTKIAANEGVCPLAAHAADYFARPTLAMVPFHRDAPPVRWVLCWRTGGRTARVAALAATLP